MTMDDIPFTLTPEEILGAPGPETWLQSIPPGTAIGPSAEWYDRQAAGKDDAEFQRLQEARAKIAALLETLFGEVIPDELSKHGATNVRRVDNHSYLTAELPTGGELHLNGITSKQYPSDPLLGIAVADTDMLFEVTAQYALPLDEACDRVRIRLRAALQALASVRTGLTRSPLPLRTP